MEKRLTLATLTLLAHGAAFAGGMAGGLLVGAAAGCGHGSTACLVVDAAQQACTVIKYMGPDGQPRQVRVSKEELQQFGRDMAQKRAVARALEAEALEPEGDKP